MGFWSRAAKSTTGGGSSASSSSSCSSSSASSSAGLRTPEWGAQTDVRLAEQDDSRRKIYRGIDETWSVDDLDKRKSETDDEPPQIPSRQFLELPAPPPLLLPLPLLPHDDNSQGRTPRKASPRSGSVETILASDSSRTASLLRDHTPTSSSEGSLVCLDDESGPSTTPTPVPVVQQPAPPRRKKRGRSRSIHLLWRSQVDASAWDALQEYYHWSTGDTWPLQGAGGLEFWSSKMELAGL